jgi:hypothetical protein
MSESIESSESSESSETSESSKIELKKINMSIPNNLNKIKKNIDIILNKDEEIIKTYIERIIYTSKLPNDVSLKLNKAFLDVRKNIL